MYGISLIVVMQGVISCSSLAVQPTASELLDRYSESLAKRQSFIATWQVEKRGSTSLLLDGKEMVDHWMEECRYDGQRVSRRTSIWGQVNPKMGIPKDKPLYKSCLWDGKEILWYNKPSASLPYLERLAGTVILSRSDENKRQAARIVETAMADVSGGPTLGYFPGEKARIDSVLRSADSMRVTDTRERVGSADCYVIIAETSEATYKVWIDPEHGHNIARAVVERRTNAAGFQAEESFEVARFEEVNGSWVPVEFTGELLAKHPGNHWSKTVSKCTTANITFDPDHDKLGSFIPDDIQEGARVRIADSAHQGFIPISYVWQDGRPVADIDKIVVDQMEKAVDQVLLEDTVPIGLAAHGRSPVPRITAAEVLEKYAETQAKLQSFIVRAETVIEHLQGKAQESRRENVICDFRIDEDRVSHRITSWDGLTTTKNRPDYASLLWDRKNLIRYRRDLESKDSRVFIHDGDTIEKKVIISEYRGAPLMGICAGDHDRVDSILREADTLSLVPEMARVGGADCVVLCAVVTRGEYTVWIDPQRGCNIVQIEVQREEGRVPDDPNLIRGKALFSLRNVRLQKIDDTWVPMEADMEQLDGQRGVKWHHRRIELILNPDHDALGSFVPDDIPDATKAIMVSQPTADYVWHKGKPVREGVEDVLR